MKGRQPDIHAQRRFASDLLRELRQRDPRAGVLRLDERPRLRAAIIGLSDEGEFVPLLRLGGASDACNVMSLFVYHHGQWMPTFRRGTPVMLAEQLAGPFAYLWAFAATLLASPSP
jgi:hypothetical protein